MIPATLPEIEAACWHELAAACSGRGHAWRTPVLATVDVDGSAADARTVVLREVDAGAQRLRFFTDARSPKLAQLAACPQGTLLMWSAALQWQLRLRVHLQRNDDAALLAARWQRVARSAAAVDYLSPGAPGSPVAAHAAARTAGAPQFAIVDARVLRMDWLALSAEGHRRAVFEAGNGRFVQP